MTSPAVEYYTRKYGADTRAAVMHVMRELGELVSALEKGNDPHAKLEIVEIAGHMEFLAKRYGFDLAAELEALYKKKLEKPPGSG
jgi:NTP pyrophosphatase (non-canonical NTP hydrolase)